MDNKGEKEEGCPRTSVKDSWTKPQEDRIESGRWGWVGLGRGWGK